jgi:hypothetical protein
MNARFIVTNALVIVVVFIAARLGVFAGFPTFAPGEYIMVGALALYALVGFIATMRGHLGAARHIMHGVTVWALPCTGIGMILAVAGAQTLEPTVMLGVFRNLVFSLAPNIFGTFMLAWLREVRYMAGGDDE